MMMSSPVMPSISISPPLASHSASICASHSAQACHHLHPTLLHLRHLFFRGHLHHLLHQGHHHRCLLLCWRPHYLRHHLVDHLLGGRVCHELRDHLLQGPTGHELHEHVLQLPTGDHLLYLLLDHIHGHVLHDVGWLFSRISPSPSKLTKEASVGEI